jgi:hypothetical protein
MPKGAHLIVVLTALVLLSGNAQRLAPTAEEVSEFRSDRETFRTYPQHPLPSWEEDLRRALADGSLDQAADALAPRYRLPPAEMRELVRLWLTVQARRYDLADQPEAARALRRRLLARIADTGRAPLVLQAVAESLHALNECSEEDFAAMMAGATDAAVDAWLIANAAPCGDNFLRAAAAAGERAMPALIRLADYGSLGNRDALALYQWLTRPEALARIAEEDRPLLAAWLYRRYVRLQFDTGLTNRAVALIEGLPAGLRAAVLGPAMPSFTATIDGLELTVPEERGEETPGIDLAVAYALAGRTADAEILFASTDIAAARRSFDCAWRSDASPPNCRDIRNEGSIGDVIDLLLLDHFLHRRAADPYPLAETGFAVGSAFSSSAPVAELRCRVFSQPQYADICDVGRMSVLDRAAGEPEGREPEERSRLGLAALSLPGFAGAHAEIAAELDRFLAENGGAPPSDDFDRQPVTPAPAPFAELPLPPAHRGRRPRAPEPPQDLAPLPEGFIPVRFERRGSRAVMISISQTYDPTGEISQGGYWMHLSSDGGRHWDRPLYTGLAQYFPYVVPAASRMPLINGDRLDLEVEVAELDTSTITYPPVGLRSRRRASNLYLQIPLDRLARDTDGDGITDIAAQRLLLDRNPEGGGTPFVVGSDAATNCGEPAPERLALMGLLERLFSVRGEAIVEPIDRSADDGALFSGWRGAAAAFDRPIFVKGDPDDYRCLRPDRLMIVYGEADIAELERYRPDFHAVKVPPIVYNHARDRGYVRWSAGWTGGTFRLRLRGGSWVFEEISRWIT